MLCDVQAQGDFDGTKNVDFQPPARLVGKLSTTHKRSVPIARNMQSLFSGIRRIALSQRAEIAQTSVVTMNKKSSVPRLLLVTNSWLILEDPISNRVPRWMACPGPAVCSVSTTTLIVAPPPNHVGRFRPSLGLLGERANAGYACQ